MGGVPASRSEERTQHSLYGPLDDVAGEAGHLDHPPRKGFFTDTSVCIGCKACEVACKEWNLVPDDGFDLLGMSCDNTGGLGASTWRHVASSTGRCDFASPPRHKIARSRRGGCPGTDQGRLAAGLVRPGHSGKARLGREHQRSTAGHGP
jgi:ferredoxin